MAHLGACIQNVTSVVIIDVLEQDKPVEQPMKCWTDFRSTEFYQGLSFHYEYMEVWPHLQ